MTIAGAHLHQGMFASDADCTTWEPPQIPAAAASASLSLKETARVAPLHLAWQACDWHLCQLAYHPYHPYLSNLNTTRELQEQPARPGDYLCLH